MNIIDINNKTKFKTIQGIDDEDFERQVNEFFKEHKHKHKHLHLIDIQYSQSNTAYHTAYMIYRDVKKTTLDIERN